MELASFKSKDFQSHESKLMIALYYVYTDTPFHIINIKKTLNDILRGAAKMLFLQRMLPNNKPVQPILLQISIHGQVPWLKGVNTMGFDNKLPYHVWEN